MYLKILFHALSKKLLIATLAIFSTTITYSETESPTKLFTDPVQNCFTPEDINNLNTYFESLNTDPTKDFQQYGINFEDDEISELQRHFQDRGFYGFSIDHDDAEAEADCAQHLYLSIFSSFKFIEDGNVLYSEPTRIYRLLKREGTVIIEFYTIAG